MTQTFGINAPTYNAIMLRATTAYYQKEWFDSVPKGIRIADFMFEKFTPYGQEIIENLNVRPEGKTDNDLLWFFFGEFTEKIFPSQKNS